MKSKIQQLEQRHKEDAEKFASEDSANVGGFVSVVFEPMKIEEGQVTEYSSSLHAANMSKTTVVHAIASLLHAARISPAELNAKLAQRYFASPFQTTLDKAAQQGVGGRDFSETRVGDDDFLSVLKDIADMLEESQNKKSDNGDNG